MENLRPSSEVKDPMGERVPEVSTILCTAVLRSENACSTHVHFYYAILSFDYFSYTDVWKKMKKQTEFKKKTKNTTLVMLLFGARHSPQQG